MAHTLMQLEQSHSGGPHPAGTAPARLTFRVAARLRQSPALCQQGRMGHRDPHRAAFFAGFILKEVKEKGPLGEVSGGWRV